MERSVQDVLDKFHYGIYLITINAEGSLNGMIASWVTQCSHEPPLVAVAIRNNRLSHSQISSTRKFAINVLSEEALDSVKRFKIPDWKRKFNGIGFDLTPGGNPVLNESLGYLDCEVERTVDTGDHTLFIARITAGQQKKPGASLSTDEYGGVYRGDK
ncbi:MAG TPA: flavin reductase family protein [Deltaproteobacteria bacterium]|nr:flavin reductase family protein [Deltaproteobacteria bacterium]HOI06827.1 flavin reductase family protein [Deltaproteobacteria bacterium]